MWLWCCHSEIAFIVFNLLLQLLLIATVNFPLSTTLMKDRLMGVFVWYHIVLELCEWWWYFIFKTMSDLILLAVHFFLIYFFTMFMNHPVGWGCRICTSPHYECPGYNTKPCYDDSDPGTLENMKYAFIAITPDFTLIQSGHTF